MVWRVALLSGAQRRVPASQGRSCRGFGGYAALLIRLGSYRRFLTASGPLADKARQRVQRESGGLWDSHRRRNIQRQRHCNRLGDAGSAEQ